MSLRVSLLGSLCPSRQYILQRKKYVVTTCESKRIFLVSFIYHIGLRLQIFGIPEGDMSIFQVWRKSGHEAHVYSENDTSNKDAFDLKSRRYGWGSRQA